MSMKHRVKGNMTVYFSLTVTAIILLFCVLFKIGRIFIIQAGGRQTLDLCASSTLGGFNSELQDYYGLYALSSIEEAREDLSYYLEKNLEMNEVRIETASVLTDEEIYDGQINEYMQFRFFVTLITQYTDLLDTLSTAQEDRDLVKEEIDTSGIVEQYNSYFSQFVTVLDGIEEDGSRTEPSVKGFWSEEWQREVYETILLEAEEDGVLHKSAITSWIEHIHTYMPVVEDSIELWEHVCEEGAKAKMELQKIYETASSESVKEQIETLINEIHTGDSTDQNILESLKKNLTVMERAKADLERLDDSTEAPYEVNEGKTLLQYSDNIYIEYELRSMKEKRSWTGLWNEMQDYVTDLSAYVNKEDTLDSEAIKELPSAILAEESADSIDLFSLPDSMEEQLKNIGSITLERFHNIEYLTGLFWNLSEVIQNEEGTQIENMNGEQKLNGVFEAEVEYVICGKASDLSNCKGTRNRVIAIRMMCNLVHLLTNPEKQKIIQTTASLTGGIIAPGIGNVIMSGIITSVWATAESYADYEQLIQGGRVSFIKTSEDWITDLDQVWEEAWKNNANTQTEENKSEKGLLYVDYLKILLLLMPERTVERRTQDLIQLNLQKVTGVDIRLTEMPARLSVEGEFTADGRDYKLKGEYGY